MHAARSVSAAVDVKSLAEQKQREELAACYRLIAHIGVEDLTYNHVTARIPGEDAFLVKPMTENFREVCASSLEKYALDGQGAERGSPRAHNALMVLHASVMQARPEIHCVIHTHSVANVAVSIQRRGLLPISQHALTLYGQIAYHQFEGYEFGVNMREAVIRDLGNHSVLVLRNHGALVVGRSIGEAYVRHHFYEMACRIQVAALSGGSDVIVPDDSVIAYAVDQVQSVQDKEVGSKDWPSCLRLAKELYPSFRD
jgi:ribulose-5-phosphate 4-epimerase/fuculose-1-phosphate aldolase